MDRPMTWILMTIAVCVVLIFFMAYLKKQTFEKVYGLLIHKRYQEFLDKVDSRTMMALFPEWMRENLKLTAYMELEDTEHVTETFNRLMKIKTGNGQKAELLVRGFQYYLQMQDGKKCKRIKEEMEQIMSDGAAKKYCRHYEIVFEHSKKYIRELEKEVQEHQNLMKGYLEYLLAKSYQSAGKQEAYLENMRRAAAVYKTSAGLLDKKVRVLI